MSKGARTRARLTALNIFYIVLIIITLIPVYYALTIALSSGGDILSSKLTLLPKNMTLDNFKTVLLEKPFFTWLKNSAILSVSTVALALLTGVPCAYSFSRFRFKGRKFVLYILLLLNAFPAILSMFAIYRMLNLVGLINTYAGLVVVYTGGMAVFAMWNMKAYFDTIPIEIEEAAKIDGANDLQLVTRIVLPLARPTIIVTAVMTLIYVWNEYVFAIQFLPGAERYTLAAGLYSLQATEYTRNWPLFAAASILVSIPVLIIFYLIQNHMASGLTAGSVKG
ncbi:MAG: ABC transporter permease subunit [Oscillospiraceae bacterium]|nr:ABC transporter permease subunit [Oscillospiraceae bacterium]